MTEYEIADYTSSIMSNFLSVTTIYFSVITTYVVAAFIAGSRLTKVQLAIVNVTFAIAAGIMGTLSYLIFVRFYQIALRGENPKGTALVDFGLPLAVLIAMMFIGSLIFMWSVRRKTGEA